MSEPFSLDHLAAVIRSTKSWQDDVEKDIGGVWIGCARAAIACLASCAPVDAGPEPSAELPWIAELRDEESGAWEIPAAYDAATSDGDWLSGPTAAAIVHRVNAFPVALAQLTAALHRAEQAEREAGSLRSEQITLLTAQRDEAERLCLALREVLGAGLPDDDAAMALFERLEADGLEAKLAAMRARADECAGDKP